MANQHKDHEIELREDFLESDKQWWCVTCDKAFNFDPEDLIVDSDEDMYYE